MPRSTRVIRLVAALATAMLLVAPAARADRLDDLERRASDLVRELEAELKAVRSERAALAKEREALHAGQAAGAPPAAGKAPATPGAETERKVDVLAAEVEQLKENLVVPPTAEYKARYGVGPAAAKVYSVARGLSVGGYGELVYGKTVADTRGTSDRADLQRFVLYTGYKFSDRIVLNSELEFEHATTEESPSSGDGEVSVELAYLDFLGSEALNARLGLVLVPLGFLNEIHEPVFFHGVNRPEVEQTIIPTTWSELGAGLFGRRGDFEYRGYVLTSLDSAGFESTGIREGQQHGNRALAESPAGALRLDWTPSAVPGLLAGASVFAGETTQGRLHADGRLVLWDAHAQYRYRGLELRGLAAFGYLDDAKAISRANGETIANQFEGHYLEIAYDVMPHLFPHLETQYLAPFFRWEHLDPQAHVPAGLRRDRRLDTAVYTLGITYKPHPQVVLKLDYRNFDVARGARADDVNLGAGFVF
jgi:hypothetical protein